jgi:large subunit ribosomal protein L17
MKHQHSNRILGRVANHRKALLKNLSASLLEHGSIITSQAKAKELRGFLEPLVTEAKKELTLARRRALLSQLPEGSFTRLQKVAAAHATRPGGYLRLTKIIRLRQDGAQEVKISFVDTVA